MSWGKAESDLAMYLGWDVTMDTVLEVWKELDGIMDPDQIGVGYYLVEYYGIDAIREVLLTKIFPELTADLASSDEDTRMRAKEQMDKMGFGKEEPEEVEVDS